MTYRFYGTSAELANEGIRLEHYGERVDLTEEQANSAILQRCPLLPEEEFQLAGHTEAELEQFHSTALHPDAPPEFLAKRSRVYEIGRKHREAVIRAEAEKE